MKRKTILAGGCVSLTGILACIVLAFNSFSLSRVKEVAPVSFLLNEANFPSAWQVGDEMVEVNWQPAETTITHQPETSYAAQQSASRFWTDNGQERVAANLWIAQRIFQYETPLKAAWWYYRNYPERIYNQQWPNFTFPENTKYRYPESWEGKTTASQEHVVCAMGGFSRCQLWYYRARYGQYIVEVEFFALNRGLDEDLFEQITWGIDAYIDSILDK